MSDVEETLSSSASASTSSSTTSTDSSQCSPPLSSTSLGTCQAASGPYRVSHMRFPVRVGISWVKGEKLEAMDFSRTWYPSKIVEIDEEQKLVLIHFEGWNQRYDEWVPMDSDKLRPVTRHSERKDKGVKKRRIHPHPVSEPSSIYRAGEQVLAKWTDCKKYPAKVSRLLEDGSYEVNFYDGVSCQIQAMNIQPMPEDMKNMKLLSMKSPPSLKPKISFKNIKVTLPESITRKVEQSQEKKQFTPDKPGHTINKTPSTPKLPIKRPSGNAPSASMGPRSGTSSPSIYVIVKPRPFSKSPLKLICLGPPMTCDAPSLPYLIFCFGLILKCQSFFNIHLPCPQCEATLTTVSESECLKLFGSTPDMATAATVITNTAPGPPPAEHVPSKKMVMSKASQAGESQPVTPEATVSSPGEQTVAKQAAGTNTRRSGRKRKKRSFSDMKLPPKQKSKPKSDAPVQRLTIKPPLGMTERARSLDSATTIASPPVTPSPIVPSPITPIPIIPPQKFIPAKAFIVEEDHNPFKCPHEGCNKAFRKAGLLTSHIKYYHTETESTTPAAAATSSTETATSSPIITTSSSVQSPSTTTAIRRRRKKTNSVFFCHCVTGSTDSDISIGSRGKASGKRQRHDSEISITTASPDLVSRDLWADVKPQDNIPDESVSVDTEEEDVESDIVNCVCGLRETNGLMIQCDICMCWQHFTCMDIHNTGVPPNNYVCLICKNAPGVRDSCRYFYDLGWEKRGELPTFSFVPEAPAEHLRSIACECNDLSGALQKIKAALHSTRRQIKISKEEGDPEFQLWQTDWDNWTKPDEDLALTPRSVDPDPSPTPSTFLFPSAPTSSLRTATDCTSSTPAISSKTTPQSQPSFADTSTILTCSSHTVSAPRSNHATIEVASTLPSPSIPTRASALDSSHCAGVSPPTGTLPMSPPASATTLLVPLTPSVGRCGALHSIQGKADKLIRDLFPGPSGDADNSLKAAGELTCATKSEVDKSLVTKTEKEHQNQHKTSSNSTTATEGNTMATEGNTTKSEMTASNISTLTLPFPVPEKQKTLISEGGGDFSKISTFHHSTPTTATLKETPTAKLDTTTALKSAEGVADNCNASRSRTEGSSLSPTQTQSENEEDFLCDPPRHMGQLFVDVNGLKNPSVGYSDDQDNDTDTAEESVDPYKNCEHNLLVHVAKVHQDIEKQLEILEQQINDLETAEHSNPTIQLSEENVLNDVPALKKSLGKLVRNLIKVQHLCIHS
ncbi:unnamed protein product [Lymnaea stagnalis]|uniref:C2H2-type domain-containing protein n=1 Tax=Lymnaea stagnalis TaxID=6523 RepID=A0AAV2HBB9_LYMST